MRKRRTVSENNKRSTKRRKVESNEDANFAPSETIIIDDPIFDWATIPPEILGDLIFKYFDFKFWLRSLSFVNKQWYQAAIRSNAEKQLFVYGDSWQEDKYLQKYCIVAARYRVSTIVLRIKKISLGRLAGLLSSSPKLHTFVFMNCPVIDACYQESTLKFPFIKTAFVHSDLLERFPNATRVQLLDEHLPIFAETLRLPSVEELAVQEASDVPTLLKTFPSLKVLHVHTLNERKSPPKKLAKAPKVEVRISSSTKNPHWRQYYSLNQTWGGNVFKTILDHSQECLQTKYTAKNPHQSIAYEISLLGRSEEYTFPAIAEKLEEVFVRAAPDDLLYCKHLDLQCELQWHLDDDRKKELVQFLKKNAAAVFEAMTPAQFVGLLKFVTTANLKKIFTKEQLAQMMKLRDRTGSIVHSLIREENDPKDLEQAIKNYGPLPDDWFNDSSLEKTAERRRRFDWIKELISCGAMIDITTFFGDTFHLADDDEDFAEEVPSLVQLYPLKNASSSKTDWLFESDWNVLSTNHKIEFLDFLVKEFNINLNDATQENKKSKDCDTSFINFIIERMTGEANIKLINHVWTKYKIDLDRVDGNGCTPLLTAISEKKPALAIWLLEKGASVHWPTDPLPLFHAVTHHFSDKVSNEFTDIILAYGADINKFTAFETDERICTPLMVSAKKSPIDMVKYLVMRGAKADLENADGFTALHWAINASQCETIEFLAKHVDVNKSHKNGLSLLIYAITTQYNVNPIASLLKAGADVNQIEPNTLKTPAMMACTLSDFIFLEELLKYNVDLKARDNKGNSLVYHFVAKFKAHHNFSSKETFLAHVKHLMTDENIAFVIAEAKKVLEQSKENVSLLDNLFRMCIARQYFAEFIIEHVGLDINKQDGNGNVLLSYPMNKESFFYLLSKNPNVDIENYFGRTPLMALKQRTGQKTTQEMLDALAKRSNDNKH